MTAVKMFGAFIVLALSAEIALAVTCNECNGKNCQSADNEIFCANTCLQISIYKGSGFFSTVDKEVYGCSTMTSNSCSTFGNVKVCAQTSQFLPSTRSACSLIRSSYTLLAFISLGWIIRKVLSG